MTAYTNRLIHEKSPYLLQHAHNPVDWYPWGEEAFLRAKKEDKPIFLSIGYSTCHWCHVMEEESFENPKAAELMNENFISIKVDREERPDLDSVYMSYVMATTGSGGWPMSVFLTPDKKPFYGGTYFPPEDRYGIPGFSNLLRSLADAWKNRRQEILKSADSAAAFLQSQSEIKTSKDSAGLTEEALKACFENQKLIFDSENGGFGRAPKFPMGHSLSLLLRIYSRFKNPEALSMVEKTLEEMAKGGLYDQIGGGFHRYSTDAQWHLPHFEKMLYDQALLVRAYVEAYQVTHKKSYEKISRETLEYVLREMTSLEGGFYSALDADSPDPQNPSKKKEGAFYVWRRSEIEALMSPKDAEIFCFAYGILDEGNVEQDPHQEFVKQNVLYEAHSTEEIAAHFKMSLTDTEVLIEAAKKKVFEARLKRKPPHLDDKILTDWNGLMIGSFAFASRVLDEPRYLKAAQSAADFMIQNLKSKEKKLLHRYREGEAGIQASLTDTAFLIYGLLELYEADFDERWLKEAFHLSEEMSELFWDNENGGFFLTSKDAEALITRPREDHDGAIPMGNSVAALDLLRLGRIMGDSSLEEKGRETLRVYSKLMKEQSSGFTQMLTAFHFALGPNYEIVIAPGLKNASLKDFIGELYSGFLPNKVVILSPSGPEDSWLQKKASYLKDQTSLAGQTTVYVCRNYACELPVTGVEDLRQILFEKKENQK